MAIDEDRFPEWRPFAAAVHERQPDTGTWCEAWTVRDIVAHQAGNAEELARVLEAHLLGEPVQTRGFAEREAPLRALPDADLWIALEDRMHNLGRVAELSEQVSPETDVGWTGRTMKVPWFAEHMREELILHGWDIRGDDIASQTRLAQAWMDDHSVVAVGEPLLQRGLRDLDIHEDGPILARLRVDGRRDVEVSADAQQTSIRLVEPEGEATLETDAAARVLLLWGRRPADPSRICSRAGVAALGRIRTLLSGY